MKTQKTKLSLYFIATIAMGMSLLGVGMAMMGSIRSRANANISPGAVCWQAGDVVKN